MMSSNTQRSFKLEARNPKLLNNLVIGACELYVADRDLKSHGLQDMEFS